MRNNFVQMQPRKHFIIGIYDFIKALPVEQNDELKLAHL